MAAVDAVELLRRQFLQLIDPELLALPPPDALRLANTQKRIFERLFNEPNNPVGPPERYRSRVLKRLVGAIESSIEDPDEDVGVFFPVMAKYISIIVNLHRLLFDCTVFFICSMKRN